MTKQEVIDFGISLPETYLDFPFDQQTAALRCRANKRIFALFLRRGQRELLNVKCAPMEADFWRSVYPDVTPGYHMNKNHWNSIWLGGGVPDSKVLEMVKHSYDLVAAKTGGTSGAAAQKKS